MNSGTMQLAGWALAGMTATLVMDVGGGAIRRTGLTRGASRRLIGRFFLSVFRGHPTALDRSIPPDASLSVGFFLVVHYAIGAALGTLLGIGIRLWGAAVPWWVPILYGLGTTALPALWMFPAMGFGLLGLRGPRELRLLPTAFVNHLLFGLGLALAARWLVPRFS